MDEKSVLIRTRDIFQTEKDDGITGYAPETLSIVANAKNVGIPEGANACGMAGKSKRSSLAMQIFGVVDPETERFEHVGFRAHGCIALIAAASVTAALMVGKTPQEALEITGDDIMEHLVEIPASKQFVLSLAPETIRAAVGDHYIRKGLDADEVEALAGCNTSSLSCLVAENCSLRSQLVDMRYPA